MIFVSLSLISAMTFRFGSSLDDVLIVSPLKLNENVSLIDIISSTLSFADPTSPEATLLIISLNLSFFSHHHHHHRNHLLVNWSQHQEERKMKKIRTT